MGERVPFADGGDGLRHAAANGAGGEASLACTGGARARFLRQVAPPPPERGRHGGGRERTPTTTVERRGGRRGGGGGPGGAPAAARTPVWPP